MTRRLMGYWRIAGTFSGGSVLRAPLLFATLLSIPLRKKILRRRPVPVRMTYRGVTFTFYLRDAADIAVLQEIFVDGEYAIELPFEPHRIVDIGGHIGATAVYFACTYPNASITVYEPDPDNFEVLRKNTVAFPRVTPVHAAVSGKEGEVVLFKNTSSISSSLREREGTVQQVRVRSRTLAQVVESGTDLVKFDVEGEEYRIFSVGDAVRHSRAYIGELHFDLIDVAPETMRGIFAGFEFHERSLRRNRSIMSAIRQ